MNVAAYGVVWIPAKLVESFLKTKWKLLDYTSNQLTYAEVAEKKPLCVLSFLPPEEIRSIPSVKWIITPGAGIDGLPIQKIKDDNQKVVNCHANSSTIAEHAWALLLATARKIPKYDAMIRSTGSWPNVGQIKDLNVDITSKAIGIVGYGAIGQKIAAYAKAFDMEISIFRKNPENGQFSLLDLNNQVEDLDYLILACPLTQETKGMINNEIIDIMPSHSVIINIARGALIDEETLFNGLREGRIRAAGLDVWQNSPYGFSSQGTVPDEFTDITNLVISPHRAWVSKESFAVVAKQIAVDLDFIAKGKTPKNLVDLDRGY